MTTKDMMRLAKAIRNVADLRGADEATIAAIVQAISSEFDEVPKLTAFKFEARGCIDLSGKDRIAALR